MGEFLAFPMQSQELQLLGIIQVIIQCASILLINWM